jgi:hypothetical protein
LPPEECTWCDTNGFDDSIRDAVRWDDPTWASRLGDVGAHTSWRRRPRATTLAFAHRQADARGSLLVDFGIVAESVIVAGCVRRSSSHHRTESARGPRDSARRSR